MKTILFATAIGFIGFFTQDGMFGEKLINAFSYINVWYWIIFVIISLILIAILAGLTFTGLDKYGVGGAIGGGILGLFVISLLIIIPILQLWLLSQIPSTINPNITSFDEITDKTYIYAFLIIAILGSLVSNKTSKE